MQRTYPKHEFVCVHMPGSESQDALMMELLMDERFRWRHRRRISDPPLGVRPPRIRLNEPTVFYDHSVHYCVMRAAQNPETNRRLSAGVEMDVVHVASIVRADIPPLRFFLVSRPTLFSPWGRVVIGIGIALIDKPRNADLPLDRSDFKLKVVDSSLVVVPYSIGRLPHDHTLKIDQTLELPQHLYSRCQQNLSCQQYLRCQQNLGFGSMTAGHVQSTQCLQTRDSLSFRIPRSIKCRGTPVKL